MYTSKRIAATAVACLMSFGALAGLTALPASAQTSASTALRASAQTSASTVPAIEERDCSSETKSWVHLNLRTGGQKCFGYRGTTGYLGIGALSMTPGNNYGQIQYSYGYHNFTKCFGNWPNGSCTTANGYPNGVNWDIPPYYYAVVQYITIAGWT
jgi:hypothetical protein